MVTSRYPTQASGTQFSTGSTSTAAKNSKSAMNTQDFVQMMITQLQNQDPMDPTKSSDLLAQMSQIGQMQASTDLQGTLKSMTLQNQIGSASALIGKTVQGLDVNNSPITGTVDSVKVGTSGVSLQLDSGLSLDVSRVTNIAPTVAATK